MDISQVFRLKRKKLATAKQKKIITLFNNLFSSGFHLVEIISFLGRSALLEKDYVTQMHQGLSKGKSFSEMMESLGFSSAIVTQLSLAEVHGNLHLSLEKIEEYLDNLAKVKKKLIEVATYPFFKKELSLIIEYGEVKSKLGSELEIYAEKTWEAFFTRVNRTMNLVQPLVFIFVALIIVLLYAAMLMPMYQNMEVNF